MDLYGLIGKSLSHSFSPIYFNNKFKKENITAQYLSLEINTIADFPQLLLAYPELKGLNVTIPYKEQIIPYLDEIDAIAKTIGAVNCIQIKEGKLLGHNTDYYGFKKSLHPFDFNKQDKAIILGTGGAARAVAAVLNSMHIQYFNTSRIKKYDSYFKHIIAYEDLVHIDINAYRLIVNTTPVGMFPNIQDAPDFPYHLLNDKHILYDLIYNPAMTTFLHNGLQMGAIIKNGLEMLELQALKSWKIWQYS